MTSVFPVSHSRHLHKRWQSPRSYDFAARVATIPLVAAELSAASASLPIGFLRQQGGFVPVAILGLADGRNACVGPDGQWTGGYIPAAFRAYPFSAAQEAEGRAALRIDEASGLVSDGPAGEPFFNEDGTPGQALLQVQQLIQQIEQNRPLTNAACALLERHGLLQPWPIKLVTPSGKRQFTGMFRIDEAALQALSAAVLAELQQAGVLALAYCQVFSQSHLARLDSVNAISVQRGTSLPLVRNPAPVGLGVPAFPPADARVLLVTHQWSTLTEMPYLVRQAGYAADVLCPTYNALALNGYFDVWIDAGVSMDTLIAALQRLARDGGYRHIIIGDDSILWKIYRERIADLWHLLPVHNDAALPILSKVGLAEHCRQHGISFPTFKRLDDRASADEAPALLGWPVVVKKNYSSGGAGIRMLQDQAAYAAYMDAHDFSEPLLAQQFMAGDILGVEALFKHGKLLQYACSEDLAVTLGPTTKRRYYPKDPDIGALLRTLGKTALLHGFVNIGMARDTATRTHYLFEADPRPNKWVPYGHWFGSDFATAFRLFMDEGDSDQDLASDLSAAQAVDCWDIEFFSTHVVKLIRKGDTPAVIRHLLDFNRTVRYNIYDPVLLKKKMKSLSDMLTFKTT